MNRKAQVQILSMVILVGIVIAMMSFAYTWGKQNIDIRTSYTEYNSAESFVLRLSDSIIDLANAGAGTTSIDIPNGRAFVSDADHDNSLYYEIAVPFKVLQTGVPVPIQTDDTADPGTFGTDQPRIITATGIDIPNGDGQLITFQIYFRELESASKSYRIALQEETDSTSGGSRITLTYAGTENQPNLYSTKIKAEIS